MMSSRIAVVARIPALGKFYFSNVVSMKDLPGADTPKEVKKLSDDQKGKWALEKFIVAAKCLDVLEFLEGKVEVPVLGTFEVYLEKFYDMVAIKRQTLEKSIERISASVDLSQSRMMDIEDEIRRHGQKKAGSLEGAGSSDKRGAKQRSAGRYDELGSDDDDTVASSSKKSGKVKKASRDEESPDDTLVHLKEAHADATDRWIELKKIQDAETERLDALCQKADRDAAARYEDDTDALVRLHGRLNLLKTYVSKLVEEMPAVEKVCKLMTEDRVDPFEEGDMIAVFRNMKDKYRKNDKIGVIGHVVTNLMKSFDGGTLLDFVRVQEEFIQHLDKLGIKSLEVSDIAAMCVIKEMSSDMRKDFLEELQKSARGLDFLAETFDEECSASAETVTLFDKIKTHGLVLQNASEMSEVFASSGKKAQKHTVTRSDVDSANRNVFAVEKSRGRTCFAWARGECARGDKCRYEHSVSEDKSGGSAAQDICFEFLTQKGCSRGSSCRFAHPKNKSKAIGQIKSAFTAAAAEEENVHSVVAESAQKSTVPAAHSASSDNSQSSNKVSSLLKSVKERDVNCVTVVADPSVMAISNSRVDCRLGWDSYCSENATSDVRVLDSNVRSAPNGMKARGLNGTVKVDKIGDSSFFGEKNFMLMENSCIPNLLSLGQACSEGDDALPTIFVLCKSGGTRLRLNKDELTVLSDIIDSAKEDNRLVGESDLINGVFVQSFDDGGQSTSAAGVASSAAAEHCEQSFAVTQLYGGRVQMDSVDTVIGLMLRCGFSEDALIHGAEYGTLKGFPACITGSAIENFMRKHGRDEAQLLANITNAKLVQPIDYVKDVTDIPGEIVVIDNIDHSMSRMLVAKENKSGKIVEKKTVVAAIGQYKDAVLAVDQASLFAHLVPRISRKDPHLVVEEVLKRWIVRWRTLKLVIADDEFVTVESQKTVLDLSYDNSLEIKVKQAVPGDHRFAVGLAEGVNRVIQQIGQGNINRLDEHVKSGLITELQKRKCWLLALKFALLAWNGGPSKHNKFISRLAEGLGIEFNISNFPMLPFGLLLIVKKLLNDESGRGEKCLYMGPSMTVRGSVIVLNLNTMSLSVKYAFIPREQLPVLSDTDVAGAVNVLYGDLVSVISDIPPVVHVSAEDNAEEDSAQEEMPTKQYDVILSPLRGVRPKGQFVSVEPLNPYSRVYKARDRRQVVMAAEKESDSRPPKPKIPTASQSRRSAEWQQARIREYTKLADEESFVSLEKDEKGNFIFPENAIVMNVLEVREFKWKDSKWLECIRAVIDGSADKREGELVYAETPSRTVFLILLSCGATSGDKSYVSDAVRAYLNALSIDRNLVARFSDDVIALGIGFEKYMLINKGVYGTRKGALSWEYWFDSKAVDMFDYEKLLLAKGIYLKQVENEVVRLFRHSDDVRVSGSDDGCVKSECNLLSSAIRMSEWKEMELFLGAEFEYLNDVVLVRQTGKIDEAAERFGDLFLEYNPKRRKRNSPLQSNALDDDSLLFEEDLVVLSTEENTRYRAIVGVTCWIVTTRFDGKFAHHFLAGRVEGARKWEMRCAVWFLEFLVNTIDWPLVLGGPIIDLEVMSDASHAIMKERRSVACHFLRTGPLSGAVYAEVETLKIAVPSIFEAEVRAASRAIDTLLYGLSVVEEMKFVNLNSKRVRIDSEGGLEWFLTSKITERSRHFQIRYFHVRHNVQEGICSMEWVPGPDNESDMLSKVMTVRGHTSCARRLLGHCLVQGLNIRGIIESEIVTHDTYDL